MEQAYNLDLRHLSDLDIAWSVFVLGVELAEFDCSHEIEFVDVSENLIVAIPEADHLFVDYSLDFI